MPLSYYTWRDIGNNIMTTTDHTWIPESLVQGTEEDVVFPIMAMLNILPVHADGTWCWSVSLKEHWGMFLCPLWIFLCPTSSAGSVSFLFDPNKLCKAVSFKHFSRALPGMLQKHPQWANTSGGLGYAPTTLGDWLVPPHVLQCLSSEHLLHSLSWVLSYDSSRAESPAAGPRADLHLKLGPVATSTPLRRVALDQTWIGLLI